MNIFIIFPTPALTEDMNNDWSKHLNYVTMPQNFGSIYYMKWKDSHSARRQFDVDVLKNGEIGIWHFGLSSQKVCTQITWQ